MRTHLMCCLDYQCSLQKGLLKLIVVDMLIASGHTQCVAVSIVYGSGSGWRNSEAGAGAGPGTTTSVMPIPAPHTSPVQCRGIQSHVSRKGN